MTSSYISRLTSWRTIFRIQGCRRGSGCPISIFQSASMSHQYSSDLTNWSNAAPDLHGTGALLSWHEAGPPVTDSVPTSRARRFYRVLILHNNGSGKPTLAKTSENFKSLDGFLPPISHWS